MVVRPALRRVHKRQNVDPLEAPTAVGISNTAVTVDATKAGAGETLLFDKSQTNTRDTEPTFINTAKLPDQVSSTQAEPTPTTSAVNEGSSSNQIPLGTVIAACVGALAGAALIILLGFWFYKRSTPKPRRRNAAPLSSRNAHGENERSRSRLENWNKLAEAGEDTWEGKYQTKEVDGPETIGPMEKLTMFKKSPSVRTAYTQKSEEHPTFDLDPHPFAQYHPNLAKELASADTTPSHPYLAKPDTGPAISWDDTTVGNDSFLSLRSNRMSGAMTPSLDIARPTPTVISSEPHHWESAEVLDFDGHAAEIVDDRNPFFSSLDRRPSSNNPFFNAQSSQAHSLPRKPSPGPLSNPKVGLPSNPRPGLPSTPAKGKGRDFTGSDANPFDDNLGFRPPILSHTAADSMSSLSSNDRAIQSLIAVLDISGEEVLERLRVASMQPSIVSNGESVYTAASAFEEDVTDAFPLPPSNVAKP